MSIRPSPARKSRTSEKLYTGFDSLDGRHPWLEAVPEGAVTYQVRELRQGRVVYFNYVLAKEMGLIDAHHPHQLTQDLEAKLIETFSLQIINEYDELNRRRIAPHTIKPHRFMATRYLQLQHTNKQGKTSGDGRGIWNGVVQHRGVMWDVSSRGTGVTCLAPGAVSANRPLKTGGTEFGYGCGQAEIDELLGAAIMAEVMHLQGIPTERILCVIDLGKGVGIGVRAAQNLIRPAHLFLYLKQERHEELVRAVDYFIDRQVKNRRWSIKAKDSRRYDEMCDLVCEAFAEFTAKLDTNYIFAWLDWDGDNVLADAGIIDYGSVRQFGIRHDQYRYDDVERFSTNLNEQKRKARLIVQVFVQMADYLKTGQKKSLRTFAKNPLLSKFDQIFEERRADQMLYRMGFTATQRSRILSSHRDIFERFDKVFSYFERAKISGAPRKVADGINHPALYNMRLILRVLPERYISDKGPLNGRQMDENEFYATLLSSYSKARDARLGEKQRRHINEFQSAYKDLVTAASGRRHPESILPELSRRAQQLNSEQRITGNALIEIVNEMLARKRRGLDPEGIQGIIDRLVFTHNGQPEVSVSRFYKETPKVAPVHGDLFTKLLTIVHQNRETI